MSEQTASAAESHNVRLVLNRRTGRIYRLELPSGDLVPVDERDAVSLGKPLRRYDPTTDQFVPVTQDWVTHASAVMDTLAIMRSDVRKTLKAADSKIAELRHTSSFGLASDAQERGEV